MNTVKAAVGDCVLALMGPGAYRATKFLSPVMVVKATRPHRFDRRSRGQTVVVTVGKPNYRERRFLKACRKAGEPLPVKKIQLQATPKKRTKRPPRKGY